MTIILLSMFGSGGQVTPPVSNSLQLPTALNTTTANPGNLVNVLSGAAAGTRILLDNGTYSALNLSNNNGTLTNPIVICPAVKANNCVFTGQTDWSGSGHLQVFGCKFQENSDQSRMVNVLGPNKTFAHCDFSSISRSLAVESGTPVNCRVHRCWFYPQNSEYLLSIKYGWSNGYDFDLGWEVDFCLFSGPINQREHISIKGGGLWLHDCEFKRDGSSTAKDIAVRHANGGLIERVRYNDGEIFVNGADWIIRNCEVLEVALAKGDTDADVNVSGSSATYFAAERCTVQRITGNLSISTRSINPATVNARDNNYSDVTGTISDSGINTGAAASVPAETVPTFTSADVGLNSYRTNVGNAP